MILEILMKKFEIFWSSFTFVTGFVDVAVLEKETFVMRLGIVCDIELGPKIAFRKHLAL